VSGIFSSSDSVRAIVADEPVVGEGTFGVGQESQNKLNLFFSVENCSSTLPDQPKTSSFYSGLLRYIS
jgi:hypothetical protein